MDVPLATEATRSRVELYYKFQIGAVGSWGGADRAGRADKFPMGRERRAEDVLNARPDSFREGVEAERVTLAIQIGDRLVGFGEELPRAEAFGDFSVRLSGGGADGPYIVVGIDPDPPLGLAEIVHFAATDVVRHAGIDPSMTTVTAYRGPSPPANTGSHRYIFVAWRQPPGWRLRAPLPQRGFSLKAWADAEGLGPPADVTFFHTRYDGSIFLAFASCLLCTCCWAPTRRPWDGDDDDA
jgi:hypothetical protein